MLNLEEALQSGLPKVRPVDLKFTRKVNDVDNFVANVRRALPREIDAALFEGQLANTLSETEFKFLSNYYNRREIANNKPVYFLRNIPQRISKSRAENYLQELGANEEDRDFLLKFYKLDSENNFYVLDSHLTEQDEFKMLRLLKLKNFHITNVEKSYISDILEKVAGISHKEVFFCNLNTPEDHAFFRPAGTKHIQGMELVETARVFYICLHHIYGGVPVQGVTFSLLKLDSEYYQYVELNFPVKFRARVVEAKSGKSGFKWEHCSMEISVFQRDAEVAKITIASRILPLKIYKKIRDNLEEEYTVEPRFRILGKFENNVSIRDGKSKRICTIGNLSTTGFMLKIFGSAIDISSDQELEFFMYFEQAGFVHGFCKAIWQKSEAEEDIYTAGFKIEQISEFDMENLKEAIRRFGHVLEERDIF